MYSERGLFIDGAWRRTGEAAENPVLDAREKGGAVVTGGSRPADRNAGFFFQPTVITGLPDDAKALFQENFGPIAAITPFRTDDEVYARANDSVYGLSARPMINSREEAERLVSYVRYPPAGTRSFGPTRVNVSAGADYGAEADGNILCFAMIETREAYERVEEIAATPGLDGLYIGPADLTLGLTGRRYRTGFDREEPEMVEAIRHVLDVAHKAGIRAALHNGSAAYAAKAIGWGFDFVTVSNDVRLLAGAAQASVAEVRKLLGEAVAADKGGPGGY